MAKKMIDRFGQSVETLKKQGEKRASKKSIIPIAKQFCKLLKKRIGAKNLKEVVEGNRHYGVDGPCASHEFCDSNIVMANAFRSLNLRDGFGVLQMEIWNEAWTLARKADFDAKKVK
jgi:hypothetical protein